MPRLLCRTPLRVHRCDDRTRDVHRTQGTVSARAAVAPMPNGSGTVRAECPSAAACSPALANVGRGLAPVRSSSACAAATL